MTNKQWKQDRKKGIGGSDISAILGLNPYKTAYDVWLDKTGQAEEQIENDNIVAGYILEDAVAKMAEHKYSIKVEEYTSENELYVHPKYEIIRGTPDRFYLDLSKDNFDHDALNYGIMEIKTTQKSIKAKEDIPVMWVLQLVWYMGIYNELRENKDQMLYGAIAYIHSGRFLDFGFEPYLFNEEMQNLFGYMVEKAERFWNDYVLTNTPPPAQNSEDMVKVYGKPEKNLKEASEELLKDYSELKELREQKKQLEEKIAEYEESIKMYIGGDHEGITYNGENIVKWSFTKGRETFDKKTLKQDHPEIYEKYVKQGEPSRRFTIR